MVIIKLPKHVKYIIETLEQNGYEAYAVGGCVRDSILGREPNDWDITTSADPYEVKKLFSHHRYRTAAWYRDHYAGTCGI